MAPGEHRRNRLAAWFETTRRPRWVLLGVLFLLYGRSLGWGFVIDDARHLSLLEDYHQSRRASLGLYKFLVSDEENRQARKLGWFPWWVGDDLRYQHWRPVSEAVLYAQFATWGRSPLGYRVVGLALYALGVLSVLAFFRIISRDEKLARWATLVFAVMAGHAIPAVFISAQSDVLALSLIAGCLALAASFVRSGGWPSIAVCVVLYALALGTKEACLPVCVLPALFSMMPWERPGARTRALAATAVLLLVGLVWLGCYASGGFGANTLAMLDPLRDPVTYLAALPGRAVVLLSSLVIPLNPFAFYLRPRGEPYIYVYCAIGLSALILLIRSVWRHDRGRRGVAPMLLWMAPFIPLLVCTVPDDRIMVLPSIGFAFVVGAWITRGPTDGRRHRSGLAIVWFVVIQAAAALGATQVIRFIETDSKASLEAAVVGFGRPLASGDRIFFVNDTLDSRVLFTQLHIEALTDVPDVKAAYLSDSENPEVHRVDERTLRIEDDAEGLLASFIGMMGTSRDRPKRVGDTFDAGEFTARVVSVADGRVTAVDLRFRRPLDCDAYRFYWSSGLDAPERWEPPKGN